MSALIARRRSEGASLIDLTLSNPTTAGFASPGVEALATLGDPRGLHYEPSPLGTREAREAVERYYAESGSRVPLERIAITASTSEAYSYLFKLLCDDGDALAVPRPSYPLFGYLAALEGLRLLPYRLDYAAHAARPRRWTPELGSVAQALDEGARAILIVSPNNPTGNVLEPEDARALDALAGSRRAALIVDEVFADFPLDPAATGVGQPLAAAARDALTFSLSGLSKVCGLPQLKLGWITLGGPEPLIREALGRLEIIADTYLSVATPVQLAAATLLAGRHVFQRECLERTRANLALIARRVAPLDSVELLPADAGWYACLRVPRLESEEELTLGLLEESNVLVHPGYFFDFPNEAFLILSLIVPPSSLGEGLERILERVTRGQRSQGGRL